jgi:magnesium transporter
MPRFLKKISKTSGLPPGALVHVGEKKIEKIRIRIIDYDEAAIEEKELTAIEECSPYKETPTVTWINIDGLHEVDVIQKIGDRYGLHPLVLEDIVNTGQRPKMEDLEDYLFVVVKMLTYDDEEGIVKAEHFSVILGRHYVISFQEKVGDVFEPIRERLRKGKGRVRKKGSDYLLYALIDGIVDNYFVVLEKIAQEVESMEDRIMAEPTSDLLETIHHLKRELIFLRKSVWPLREAISSLERGDSSLIQEKTTLYLRDVYDHTIQVADTIETLRDMVSGMLDVYLSSVSNRMNEVMKVLTIIATIFIPMTFLAGIYGMNFKNMPELEWAWGYPLVWFTILVLGIFMVLYFKRKKWL